MHFPHWRAPKGAWLRLSNKHTGTAPFSYPRWFLFQTLEWRVQNWWQKRSIPHALVSRFSLSKQFYLIFLEWRSRPCHGRVAHRCDRLSGRLSMKQRFAVLIGYLGKRRNHPSVNRFIWLLRRGTCFDQHYVHPPRTRPTTIVPLLRQYLTSVGYRGEIST